MILKKIEKLFICPKCDGDLKFENSNKGKYLSCKKFYNFENNLIDFDEKNMQTTGVEVLLKKNKGNG